MTSSCPLELIGDFTPECGATSANHKSLSDSREQSDKSVHSSSLSSLKKPGKLQRIFKKVSGGNTEQREKYITPDHQLYELSNLMKRGISLALEYSQREYSNVEQCRDVDSSSFKSKIWFNLTEGHDIKEKRRASKEKSGTIFKSYASEIFHRLRHLFNVHYDELKDSLCIFEENWIDFVTNSKSGQYFFVSQNERFIIKTIRHSEMKFATEKFLPAYYRHIEKDRNSFLVPILGMFRVQSSKGRRYFFVMKSVFDTPLAIHSRYDLKGSTKGRMLTDAQREDFPENPALAMKDIDFKGDCVDIVVGDEQEIILDRLKSDVAFLESINLMDYSLLLGIHDRRKPKFKISHAKTESMPSQGLTPLSLKKKSKSIISADQMEEIPITLGDIGRGILSPLENQRYIYWIGIIDIFQVYNTKKKLEYQVKGKWNSKKAISAVPAQMYAIRFLDFIRPHIKKE